MGGPRGRREEVLTATDPRHRDNLGGALLQALASGGVARGMTGGYTRPVLRYHSGGIAGMQPDGLAALMGSAGGDGNRRSGRRGGGDTYNITLPPGTSRETADQIASRIAQRIGAASRRNN